MLELFPFGPVPEYLEEEDFSLFASSIRQRIAARIPMSGSIHFIRHQGSLPKIGEDPGAGRQLAAEIVRMQQGKEQPSMLAGTILLPFRLVGDQVVVVAVTRVDPLVVERSTGDWLADTRDGLTAEVLAVKRTSRDPETGLLNSRHLFATLQEGLSGGMALLLVQLSALRQQGGGVFQNSRHGATALFTFTDSRFMLHHLGQGVFALLVLTEDIGSIDQFSSRLVQYLRREKFLRVHLGSTCLDKTAPLTGERVLAQAWTALRAAVGRGPFSFCDYSFLANAERHPLRPASLDIRKRYRQLNRRDPAFALVQLRWPGKDERLQDAFQKMEAMAPAVYLGFQQGVILYLPAADGCEGMLFAEKLIRYLVGERGMEGVYGG
ncbi:MAG: hypothetical protein ACK5PS_04080 [Desulfopila sp.]